MALSEFELIGRFFQNLGAAREDVLLGVGDDAALLDVGAAEALVLCADTLTEGVHFPVDAPAEAVGHKALAVNLSDLAAMGARPAWALLALSLPRVEPLWLADFRRGLHSLAEAHGVALVGGDTTRGPLSLSLTLAGQVEPAQALRRDGARPGDLIYVSGSLGEAAAGLELWRKGQRQPATLIERLHRPTPRLALGRALRRLASAAVDVSDGLAADLGHVLTRSGVGARVEVSLLPRSPALRAAVGEEASLALALSGGDDYELCFTVPPERAARLESLDGGVALTRIGVIETEPGLRLTCASGRALAQAGFDHFRGGAA